LGRRVSWSDHPSPTHFTSPQIWERVLGLRD
jgi:hypothetical protein